MTYGVSWGVVTRRFNNGDKLYSAKKEDNAQNVTFKDAQDVATYIVGHAKKDVEFEIWAFYGTGADIRFHNTIYVECNDFLDDVGNFDKDRFKNRVEGLLGKIKEGQ